MKQTPCPHAVAPVVICWRCAAANVDPPENLSPRAAVRIPVKKHRPRGYMAKLPGGIIHTFERVSASMARKALRHMLGRRAPNGTTWEAMA